jgi:hypothetical protein
LGGIWFEVQLVLFPAVGHEGGPLTLLSLKWGLSVPFSQGCSEESLRQSR